MEMGRSERLIGWIIEPPSTEPGDFERRGRRFDPPPTGEIGRRESMRTI